MTSIKHSELLKALTNLKVGASHHSESQHAATCSKAHNLLTVFDMQAKGYPFLPADAIQQLDGIHALQHKALHEKLQNKAA